MRGHSFNPADARHRILARKSAETGFIS